MMGAALDAYLFTERQGMRKLGARLAEVNRTHSELAKNVSIVGFSDGPEHFRCLARQ